MKKNREITFKYTKTIQDTELRPLYESVGWVSYTARVFDLATLITNSQLVVSAWDNEKLIGLARTVGDGISIAYLQDLLVLPTYQKQGIGGELLQKMLEMSKGIRQFVTITDGTDENRAAIAFYKKHGLQTFDEKPQICGLWRVI